MPARSKHRRRHVGESSLSGVGKFLRNFVLIISLFLSLVLFVFGLWLIYLPTIDTVQNWLFISATNSNPAQSQVKVFHYDPQENSLQEVNLEFELVGGSQAEYSWQLQLLIDKKVEINNTDLNFESEWGKAQVVSILLDQFKRTRQVEYLSLAKSIFFNLEKDQIEHFNFDQREEWLDFLSGNQLNFNDEQCSIAVINTTQVPALASYISGMLTNSGARVVRTGNSFINLDTDLIQVADTTQDKCRGSLEKINHLFEKEINTEISSEAKTIYRADIVIFAGKEISSEWEKLNLQ